MLVSKLVLSQGGVAVTMLHASPDLLDDSVPAVRPRTYIGGLPGHHRIEDNDQEDAIVVSYSL